MPPSPFTFYGLRFLIAAAITLAILLRVLFLSSDPYPHLDWSSGLLTDESFYAHNARNLALFGRARTDEFNNMLLSPVVHGLQWVVFSVFGTGYVQARLIAGIATLAALGIFFAAMRRGFGIRVAGAATLFLGLDHTALLYSRMALLDSFAVFPCVAAFYCFVRGAQVETNHRVAWFSACGILLMTAVTNRSLCLYLLPVPAIALRYCPGRTRALVAVYVAAALAAFVYVAAWYGPNRVEIGRMATYYRQHQLQPESVKHAGQNIYHALLGDRRGIASYLFRHTPLVFTLAILGLVGTGILARRPSTDELATNRSSDPATRYLAAWLILGGLLVSVISYSPSRYYVALYPALCGLAGVTFWRIPHLARSIRELTLGRRVVFAVLYWFISYHFVQVLIHRGEVVGRPLAAALLHGIPSVVAAGALIGFGRVRDSEDPRMPGRFVPFWIGAWAVINAVWLAHWFGTLRWSQVEMGDWLNRNLPTGSVALGDVAAGLGLGHRFLAVNVIPGLCNGNRPVEGFAGAPRYIVILDGPWKERYWQERYPALVRAEKRIHAARVLKWNVGVYEVDSQSP